MAIQLNGSKANKNVKEYHIALKTDLYANKLTQEHMKLKYIDLTAEISLPISTPVKSLYTHNVI